MAEYIRREDYCEENCGKENREGYKTCTNCGMLNVPSADVQPVKQGRWIISNLYAQCSECSVAYDLDTFQRLIPMNENVPRHCTYCGSKNGLEGR